MECMGLFYFMSAKMVLTCFSKGFGEPNQPHSDQGEERRAGERKWECASLISSPPNSHHHCHVQWNVQGLKWDIHQKLSQKNIFKFVLYLAMWQIHCLKPDQQQKTKAVKRDLLRVCLYVFLVPRSTLWQLAKKGRSSKVLFSAFQSYPSDADHCRRQPIKHLS